MKMAFNNINSQGQMFPNGNRGGVPPSIQQSGGFQQGQPYGMQGFVPRNPQLFGAPFPGYQMRSQMSPSHMGPRMGLQVGAFPSNVQLGHQFPKQQQKLINQQRKIAEENQKKQDELQRKKQFEIQQRKLQSLNAKQGPKSNPLNDLFGKRDKGGMSSMSGLIGSLGQGTSTKPAQLKASSVFSRPGDGAAVQHSHPGQWGSGFLTTPGQPVIPRGSGGSFIPNDTFGGFEQGPTFSGQDSASAEFSDFQEAQPAIPNFEGGFSQTPSWSSPAPEPPRSIPVGMASMPSGYQHGAFPLAQNNPVMSSASGIQGTTSSRTSAMVNTQGVGMINVSSNISRSRSGSLPGTIAQIPGNNTVVTPVHHGIPHQNHDNLSMNAPLQIPGSMMIPPSTTAPSVGTFKETPAYHGSPAAVPSMDGSILTQGNDTSSVPTTPTSVTQETVPEVEETPERKLELLYGTVLPDWCVNGTDLPGIYKDVAENTITLSDVVDTNQLFPILMASDLPRDKLGHIWNQANRATPGQLNALELRIVLGLVALGQAGIKTERLTVEKLGSCKAAPIPTIPESALQTRGRGWSFTEQLSNETEKVGGPGVVTDHGNNATIITADPNDKYSVFRTVNQHEVISGPSGGPTAFNPTDPSDNYNILRTPDQHAVNAGGKPAEILSFPGVNRMGDMTHGGSNTMFGSQDQQQEFGDFQTKASWASEMSQSSLTNQEHDFGNFQGNSDWQSNINLTSSNQASTLKQSNFGDFQTDPGWDSGTKMTSDGQQPADEFGTFKGEGKWITGSIVLPAPNQTAVNPQEDDFGDFQTGNEPEQQQQEQRQQQQQKQSVDDFGGFHGSHDGDFSDFTSFNSFPNIEMSNSKPENEALSLDNSSKEANSNYKEFCQIPGPVITDKKAPNSTADTSVSSKLASSLEKFKMSNSFPSSKVVSPGTSVKMLKGQQSEKATNDEGKQDNYAEAGKFANFHAEGNKLFKTLDTTNSDEDRYSVFRDADFSSAIGVFNPTKGVTEGAVTASANDHDGGFADFGQFETTGEQTTEPASNFVAFQSGEVFTQSDTNKSFDAFGNLQPTPPSSVDAFSSNSTSRDIDQEFGDFCTSSSNSSFVQFTSFDNTETSRVPTVQDDNGTFGAFTSASNSRPYSLSNASDTLINSVSLEPSERYKVLSQQSVNVDQHEHVWSRCLNSCLLTLASASLAIEKMKENSVKKEVLESKQGATYFAAIVEIYRVTVRIKVSMEKAAPNTTKLKEISQEIERTWRNIVNFLSGSDFLPLQSSLDFSLHHVSSTEGGSVACGICLLNVNKSAPGGTKQADGKLTYGGRQYHTTCANFWCNRVDSVLPSLLPVDSLI